VGWRNNVTPPFFEMDGIEWISGTEHTIIIHSAQDPVDSVASFLSTRWQNGSSGTTEKNRIDHAQSSFISHQIER